MFAINKGRRLKIKDQKFKHYEPKFKKFIKNEFPKNSNLHYEDSDIDEFPANTRYTKNYLSSLKLTRKFGNKCIQKYKKEFTEFLKTEFGGEAWKDYVENRNEKKIKLNFSGEKRYTQEYILYNELSKKRVQLLRLKKEIQSLDLKNNERANLDKFLLCNQCLQIQENSSHLCNSKSTKIIDVLDMILLNNNEISMETQDKIDFLTKVKKLLNNVPNELLKPYQQHTNDIENIVRFDSQRSIEQIDGRVHSFGNDAILCSLYDNPDSGEYSIPIELLAQESVISSTTNNDENVEQKEEEKQIETKYCFEFKINSEDSPYYSNFFEKENQNKLLGNYF